MLFNLYRSLRESPALADYVSKTKNLSESLEREISNGKAPQLPEIEKSLLLKRN